MSDIKDKLLGSITKHASGCWTWNGAKLPGGYGAIHLRLGKNKYKCARAHRVSYEIFIGKIPKGLSVCHSCDNPSCVNPKHLWAGTTKQNADDRDEKNRHWVPKGNLSPHSKISQSMVNKIRAEYDPNVWGDQERLSKKYKLCSRHIYKIVNNKIWR